MVEGYSVWLGEDFHRDKERTDNSSSERSKLLR